MFNVTFNNISAISWRSVLLVEETGEPRENHRPAGSCWQTLLHNVVSPWMGFEHTTLAMIGTDTIGSFICMFCWSLFCPFVLFLLAIVLSVLRYTDSDCPLVHSITRLLHWFNFLNPTSITRATRWVLLVEKEFANDFKGVCGVQSKAYTVVL